jgi:hypothetical protein
MRRGRDPGAAAHPCLGVAWHAVIPARPCPRACNSKAWVHSSSLEQAMLPAGWGSQQQQLGPPWWVLGAGHATPMVGLCANSAQVVVHNKPPSLPFPAGRKQLHSALLAGSNCIRQVVVKKAFPDSPHPPHAIALVTATTAQLPFITSFT